jgi:hypothetical protein
VNCGKFLKLSTPRNRCTLIVSVQQGHSGKNYAQSVSCSRTKKACSVSNWFVAGPSHPGTFGSVAPHLRTLFDSDHLPLTSAASFLFCGPRRDLASRDPQYYVFLIRIILSRVDITVISFQFSHLPPLPHPGHICIPRLPGKCDRHNAPFPADSELASDVLYSGKFSTSRYHVRIMVHPHVTPQDHSSLFVSALATIHRQQPIG